MIDSKAFSQILMSSGNSVVAELPCQILVQMCKRPGIDAGLVCLTDGTTTTVLAKEGLESASDVQNGTVLGDVYKRRCASVKGSAMGGPPLDCCLLKANQLSLPLHGFRRRTCVPISLGGTPIGGLCALSRSARTISKPNAAWMSAEATKLALKFHHAIFFPELGSKWVEAESRQLDEGDLAPDARYRRGEASNVSASEFTAADALPKGISRPTLERVYRYLRDATEPVTRKSLALSLGFTDVTSGTYLKYLTGLGVADELAIYGPVGRPALVYRLQDRASLRLPARDFIRDILFPADEEK